MRVRGYASVFGNQDLSSEVIDRGAFSDWIAKNPDKQLPIFFNHSHIYNPDSLPIGVTTMLRQDRRGLYFEGELNDTTQANEVKSVLATSGRMEASFAFYVDTDEVKKSVRHLKAVSPFEITAANWGVNPKAYIEAVPELEE